MCLSMYNQEEERIDIMSISDISLTSGMRKNLVSMQETTNLMNRTEERLSTGKKVNSALDNPVNFFTAQSHMNRASDLDTRKDAMSEAIQLVNAADAGIEGITSLIENAKGLAQAARSSDASGRANLALQYNEILKQITDMANDSSYKGKNLLKGDSLTVEFNEDGSNTLTVTGFDATQTGLSVSASVNNWATDDDISAAVSELEDALGVLRSQAASLASNLSVITVRQDFTTNMINTLTTGADNLTLADTNEESANMLMLQTRQSLGTTALSLSSDAAQAILKLF